MSVIFGDAGDVAVRLDWFYDDFFSLLVTTDLGIDEDGDLILTAAEQTLLDEQITAWPPDYQGDLEVMQGDVVLPLADKRDHRMTFTDGLFHEAHLRPVAAIEDPAAPLVIRAYDPTFYVAYELVGPVKIQGRDDCKVDIAVADVDAAYAMTQELLGGRDASEVAADEYFPEVGDAFADVVTVTCAGPL